MVLNKIISIFNSSVDFDFYFIFIRIINSLFSFTAVIFTFLIYKKIFKDKKGSVIALFLASLNWRLIHHSHYVNQDTFLMVFTISSIYFFISYLEKSNKRSKYLFLLLSSVLFGFGVGTKITALISAPIVGLVLLFKKDVKGIIFLHSRNIISIFSI
ncbi:phospholipid carrier-dependent glycosyltransferase [Patescibacteria group bacterium]|nr:phospholipid carrier-dependent glycosyltransferase [Patescibacteria group bacterium]